MPVTQHIFVRSEVCATFAPPGQRPVRCGGCRLEGDVDVRSKKCEVCMKVQATFAPPGQRPVRCGRCRFAGDVNVLNKMCATPGCGTRVTLYKFCANCDPHRVRTRTRGEAIGRDALAEAFPEEEGWILTWDDGRGFAGDDYNKLKCNERGTLNEKRYRGDFFLENPKKYPCKVVYGEHDENQHKDYNQACDAGRTAAILQWRIYDHPMLMFRINPDSYELKGKKIPGWQVVNSNGERQQNRSVIKERYQVVIKDVKKYFDTHLEELKKGPEIMYNRYFFDNKDSKEAVQRYSFQGATFDEYWRVSGLDLEKID